MTTSQQIAAMKVAIAICLFAFVGIQLGPVTADIPIDDMADWDCVADGLQLAAEKYPQFAHLYEQLAEFYQTFAIEARKCNDTNDWVRQLYCQCEWKTLVEKMNKEFYDLVHAEVSCVKEE